MSDANAAPDEALVRLIWQEARDAIKRLEGSSVKRLSVQTGEYKVEIEFGSHDGPLVVSHASLTAADRGESARAAAVADSRVPVVAPLVGTFYRSPQPGARAFVEEGDVVEPGQTVGIVEAMKIMNQVSSEHRGRVAELPVKDGEWVEFQQILMYLEPLEAAVESAAGS